MSSPAAADTGRRVRQWYRDAVSCLQSTLATVLLDAGEDPLAALGLAWEFRYQPGGVRPEEFYWPCRHPGDLARSHLPYHPVSSAWRDLPAGDPLSALERALARAPAGGCLPVLAVDNYHLPFRPAYHDVHAAHLVVVYGVDRASGLVSVSDAMPPAFDGPVPVADLLRACGSDNPPDGQGRFFSGRPVGARWLDVRLTAAFPALDRERLATALTANLRGFAAGEGPGHTGTAGLERFRRHLAEAAGGDTAALHDVYTFGWAPQAQSALHGELLRRCGAAWGVPELAEAGRRVEHVAHRWSAVRVTAAHRATAPPAEGRALVRHAGRLARAYAEALASVEEAVDALGRREESEAT